MIEVYIENNQQTLQIPQNTNLLTVAKLASYSTTYRIFGALVNNKIKELSFKVFESLQIKFIDINTVPNQTETLKPLDVYAVNQNVLRIMSGMGGLAYSN